MLPSNVLTAGIILLVTMSPAARSHVLKKPGVHHHHSASCREVSSLLESLQSGSFTACNQHPAVSKYEVEMMADWTFLLSSLPAYLSVEFCTYWIVFGAETLTGNSACSDDSRFTLLLFSWTTSVLQTSVSSQQLTSSRNVTAAWKLNVVVCKRFIMWVPSWSCFFLFYVALY